MPELRQKFLSGADFSPVIGCNQGVVPALLIRNESPPCGGIAPDILVILRHSFLRKQSSETFSFQLVLLLGRIGPSCLSMEKLRAAKSAFEHAANDADAAATAKKTAVGLAYVTEALIDLATELQEVKALLGKTRKDMNESSQRMKEGPQQGGGH